MADRVVRAGAIFFGEEKAEKHSCKQKRQERAAAEMKGGQTEKGIVFLAQIWSP